MAMLAILILPLSILGFTALAVVLQPGSPARPMPGRTASARSLYAYTSATGNNGSAFAGLSANTPFYNTTLGLAMLIGRFLMIVPMLAVAGSLAAKKIVPASAGTFPTDGGLFVGLLDRRDPDRRRPDLLPGPRARPGRRASRDARRHPLLIRADPCHADQNQPARRRATTLLDPAILLPAIGESFRKLDPRALVRNPVMFVVEVVAALTTLLFLRDLRHRSRGSSASPSRSISGCGSPCCSPISPRRWRKAAARRRRPPCGGRAPRRMAKRLLPGSGGTTIRPVRVAAHRDLQAGRYRAGRGGRPHPERRRGDRRHRLGRRSRPSPASPRR